MKLVLSLSSLSFLLLSACASAVEAPPPLPAAVAGGAIRILDAENDQHVVAEVLGDGPRTLLFVHGWGTDRSLWRRQMVVFGVRDRVVALDLPGHGRASAGRAQPSIGAYGGDVVGVMEQLGLDEVVLVGHSLGGLVALEAAARAPERVRAVVVVEALLDVDRRVPREQWDALRAAFLADFPGTVEAFTAGMFGPTSEPALRTALLDRMTSASPEHAVELLEEQLFHDEAGALARARVPVRAINGDQRPTEMERNRRLARDYEARILPGAHFLVLEEPQAFNAALAETLEALPPASAPSGR